MRCEKESIVYVIVCELWSGRTISLIHFQSLSLSHSRSLSHSLLGKQIHFVYLSSLLQHDMAFAQPKNLDIKLINQSFCMYGILFRLVRARHNIHLINGERSKSAFSIIDESRKQPNIPISIGVLMCLCVVGDFQ